MSINCFYKGNQYTVFSQVFYEKGGIFIHFCNPKTDDDVMLGGTLKVVEKVYLFLSLSIVCVYTHFTGGAC